MTTDTLGHMFGTCPKTEHMPYTCLDMCLQKIPVLELVTFDDGDPLEGSSSTPVDAYLGFDIEEKDGGESSGSGRDFDASDMEEDN